MNVIIGVVGGTKRAKEQALDFAKRIGRSIAKSRSILVTGGKADESESSVKARAMCGAVSAANSALPVGAVGIIPDETRNPPVELASMASNPSCHLLYLYTGVSSYQRNILTGQLADVLIALPGEKGTLSEVAYAVNAGRPVVFLESWEALRSHFKSDTGSRDVSNIIRELGEPAYKPDKLIKNLESLFGGSVASSSYAVLNGLSPENAVEIALVLGRARQANSDAGSRYPTLDGSTLKAFKAAFEGGLELLEKHVGP